jgi:hypothetical protein
MLTPSTLEMGMGAMGGAARRAMRGAKKAQKFVRPETGRATMVGKLEILFAPEPGALNR